MTIDTVEETAHRIWNYFQYNRSALGETSQAAHNDVRRMILAQIHREREAIERIIEEHGKGMSGHFPEGLLAKLRARSVSCDLCSGTGCRTCYDRIVKMVVE